jgi:hypothetical protein
LGYTRHLYTLILPVKDVGALQDQENLYPHLSGPKTYLKRTAGPAHEGDVFVYKYYQHKHDRIRNCRC